MVLGGVLVVEEEGEGAGVGGRGLLGGIGVKVEVDAPLGGEVEEEGGGGPEVDDLGEEVVLEHRQSTEQHSYMTVETAAVRKAWKGRQYTFFSLSSLEAIPNVTLMNWEGSRACSSGPSSFAYTESFPIASFSVSPRSHVVDSFNSMSASLDASERASSPRMASPVTALQAM